MNCLVVSEWLRTSSGKEIQTVGLLVQLHGNCEHHIIYHTVEVEGIWRSPQAGERIEL